VPAQCVLVALIHIAKDATVCQLVGELHCIETLLRLLQDYELPFKGLVATLLQVNFGLFVSPYCTRRSFVCQRIVRVIIGFRFLPIMQL
jgi:hypothetical protein